MGEFGGVARCVFITIKTLAQESVRSSVYE
jgi:hypothetical protein